ncbi:MAG: hypothetical protein KGL90_10830 [Burkholderiales bacterium]|nr:hypothetical protein [Burkholderiales bacterium]
MKFNKMAITALTSTLLALPLSALADKKEWVQKLLTAQQPSLENTARNLAEQPARQLVAASQSVLAQAVPADKREATAQQIDAEIKKYLEAAGPAVRASTLKLSQSVIGPLFEEKFTEEELKQLVGMLESPVLKKYQGLLPEVSNSLLEKVIADARPQVDPKLQVAQTNIRAILDKASGGKLSAGAPSADAPAKAAKPAAKK